MLRLFISLFLIAPAIAQTRPSAEMEALGARLMQEINAGIQCHANAIVGRQKIEELEKEVERLKKELADAKR